MFSFGFYNSQNEDRLYNASHFGKIFDGVIQDGVFGTIKATDKQPFQLDPTSTPSLTVNINIGKAWLAHTWNLLDSMASLTFDQVTSPGNKRTDAVCIEVNNSYSAEGFTPRTNSIVIVKGSNVSYSGSDVLPSLTEWQKKNSVGEYIIWRFPIAYVTIYGSDRNVGTIQYKANVIESVNIKSAINPDGAVEADKYKTWTPLVTGATLDATDYIPNTQEFNAAMTNIENNSLAQFNTWYAEITSSLVGEFVPLGSGESWQPNIKYYELVDSVYVPTTDETQDPSKQYYYMDTADSIVQLNNKIDNKILYGVSDPTDVLEIGQVYFKVEG